MVLSMWNTPRLTLYGGAAGTLYAAYDLAGHWSLDPNAMAYCLGGLMGGAAGGALLVAAFAGLRNVVVRRYESNRG
jgi:hypothetical protein